MQGSGTKDYAKGYKFICCNANAPMKEKKEKKKKDLCRFTREEEVHGVPTWGSLVDLGCAKHFRMTCCRQVRNIIQVAKTPARNSSPAVVIVKSPLVQPFILGIQFHRESQNLSILLGFTLLSSSFHLINASSAAWMCWSMSMLLSGTKLQRSVFISAHVPPDEARIKSRACLVWSAVSLSWYSSMLMSFSV